MNTMKNYTLLFTLGCALLSHSTTLGQTGPEQDMGPGPMDLSANTLSSYRAQADAAMPTFDTSMLAAPNGFDWVGNLLMGRLAIAMNDFEPAQTGTNGAMTIGTDTARTTVMKIDTDRGRVRYINLDRQFDWETSSHTAIDEPVALDIVLQAMAQLNVPTNEFQDATGACSSCQVATIKGDDFDDSDPSGTVFSTHEAERMVTARRTINGRPVFDSMLRASVSNDGQIARMLARWPQFRLPPGLVMRTRDAVLDDIAAGIWSREMGAALSDLQVQVGYLAVGGFHIPVADVAMIDRDSGAGFHIPLVMIPVDDDLDGVIDTADNCVGIHNAAHQVPLDCNGDGDTTDPGEGIGQQCDRDGDGVGDICDNCPDVANTAQTDTDGDATGDACQESEGACCGVGEALECDNMTASTCLIMGGEYQGDGSACLGDTNGDGRDDACGCSCAGAADCVDLDGNAVIDDACIWGDCNGAPCGTCTTITKAVPADISGPFGGCTPDGFCNVHDRNQALACFAGSTTCAAINIDAGGAFGACPPDGFCNIHDANHALGCFAGTNTCGCGAQPEGAVVESAGVASLNLVGPRRVDSGALFAVKVSVDGPIKSLQSYQLHLEASGGSRGQVELVEIRIDDDRTHPFAGRESFQAVNVETQQALSGLNDGGVAVRDRGYLATFVYRATKDASGTFVIDALHTEADDQTFLISDFTKAIDIVSTQPATIAVRPSSRR